MLSPECEVGSQGRGREWKVDSPLAFQAASVAINPHLSLSLVSDGLKRERCREALVSREILFPEQFSAAAFNAAIAAVAAKGIKTTCRRALIDPLQHGFV